MRECGLELVLPKPRPAALHEAAVGGGRDPRSALHLAQFDAALDEPLRVQ